MNMQRAWAMPSKNTFGIKPIKQLLAEEVGGGIWIDPFSGGSRLATITNDMNPDVDADHHLDAIKFLQTIKDSYADGVLFDPPYSVRQVAECYKHVGHNVTNKDTRSDWYTKIKHEIARIVVAGGKVISCGWHSNGIGKTLGFEKTRILLVAHGGVHNDTIITVEVKHTLL